MIRFRSFKPDSAGLFTDEIFYAGLVLTFENTEHPELVVLRNGKMMENRFLSNYRNAIKYKVQEAHSYRLFWRPIANKLNGIKKVYFSPDGIYNQISINTLQNPATKKYTIDELEIKVVTNTKDLVEYVPTSNKGDGKVRLFGFPNYNMGLIDEQKGTSENSDADKVEIDASDQRGARGARATRGSGVRGDILRGLRGNLQRYINSNTLLAMLPGTQKEIQNISKEYDKNGNPSTALFGNEALEDSIKSINNPKTLQIATHGFFLENQEQEEGQEVDSYIENPILRSGLILAGANSFLQSGYISKDSKDGEEGILTVYEAMNLNLDQTDLVVLSACETGLGEISNGEGVYGLQRSFQIAGAKSVIMSMWTVDDAATQELMTNFYSEWLETGDKNMSFINPIYSFIFEISEGAVTSQELSIEKGGAYTSADFESDGFDLLINPIEDNINTAVLLTTGDFGDGVQIPTSAIGWLLDDTFEEGTYYFYVTADISIGAIVTNNLNVSAPTLDNFSFVDPNEKLDGGLTDGGTFTFNAIPQPALTLTNPNGGEKLEQNGTASINWTVDNFVGDESLVIEYSNNGSTWIPIGSGIVDNLSGEFDWFVDATKYAIGTSYKLRIRNANNSVNDVSDNFFEVIPSGTPSISVLSPNGGETFTQNDIGTITFVVNGLNGDETLAFDVSSDTGVNWETSDLVLYRL